MKLTSDRLHFLLLLLLCPRIWGANWFLIRDAVSAAALPQSVEIVEERTCEIRARESGLAPGCQQAEPMRGGGGRLGM